MKWFWILIRYILSFVVVLSISLFYFIFTPITSGFLFLILNLFYKEVLFSFPFFIFNSFTIEIIPACIAGSAYVLLLLLNLLTPNIKIGKRILLFLFSSVVFLFINVIRIFLSVLILDKSTGLFSAVHMGFWFLSIVFVILIWFLSIKLFKINEKPVYTDLKFILKNLRKK